MSEYNKYCTTLIYANHSSIKEPCYKIRFGLKIWKTALENAYLCTVFHEEQSIRFSFLSDKSKVLADA